MFLLLTRYHYWSDNISRHSDIVIEPSFVFEQGGTMVLLTVFHM